MVGHEVKIANDGPHALEILPGFQPDFGVLDLGLPVMDGYELATRMRERTGRLRLIAVTGYGLAEDRARSRSAGFDAHLVKPVELDELSGLIVELGHLFTAELL